MAEPTRSTPAVPVEAELVYEVMPCNALRVAQEPAGSPHACAYFREWGTYHGYDYDLSGPPPEPGIVHESHYVGRVVPVPELLSGCRKAPLMAVGINPNLPGWWPQRQNSLTPLFDDYRQYAHYFRYRSTAKLEIPRAEYLRLGGGPDDSPFSDVELAVPVDEHGRRPIPVRLQPQRMYRVYQQLLDSFADAMDWAGHALVVGEDLSYGNMVASASAKWTTVPAPDDPQLPPMTGQQRDGIVAECFHKRRYLLRQLFQSLPAAILVLGQSTANAFIGELAGRFSAGAPQVGEPVTDLLSREVRLRYGTLPDGTELDARVIFVPHATGDPDAFAPTRNRIVDCLVAEARAGRLRLDPATGHLWRTPGSCVFCPLLEIGVCDYTDQLRPLAEPPAAPAGPELAADRGAAGAAAPDQVTAGAAALDREIQLTWEAHARATSGVPSAWAAVDDAAEASDPVEDGHD